MKVLYTIYAIRHIHEQHEGGFFTRREERQAVMSDYWVKNLPDRVQLGLKGITDLVLEFMPDDGGITVNKELTSPRYLVGSKANKGAKSKVTPRKK